jgi:hypothetical protein
VCPDGTVAGSGASACTSCAAGSFAGDTCTACTQGTYASAARSTACTACAKGFFASTDQATACTACTALSYANTTGASACLLCTICGANSQRLSGACTATANTLQCACNAGYEGSDTCTACPAGWFKGAIGGDACAACAPGTYSAPSGRATQTGCEIEISSSNSAFRGDGSLSLSQQYVVGQDCVSGSIQHFNYAPNENVWLTLAPAKAQTVSLSIAWLDTEESFDILTLYPSCVPPSCLLGGVVGTEVSGNVRPALPLSQTGVWGIGFTSDDTTQFLGWRLDFQVTAFVETGYTSCTHCTAGQYASAAGSSACTGCDAGSYTNGTSACRPCTTCAATAERHNPCGLGATNDSVTCVCGAGYYGPGTTCALCPLHTASIAGNTSSILSCECLQGYLCVYTKRVVVTVRIPGMTLAEFDEYQTAFVAAIARAATVNESQVTILAVKQGRRLLSHIPTTQRELTVKFVVLGVTTMMDSLHHHHDMMRRTLHFEMEWQPDHLLEVVSLNKK